MEDVQNGAVVAAQAPSDTCGIIENYDSCTPQTVSIAPSCGLNLNNNNNSVIKGQLKAPGNTDHRIRRPRRGKRKSKKMPYVKDRNDRMYRRKAVAPNNTNQFLMDDHNDGPDIDLKLLEVSARYNHENGRTRNSSYTSVESDVEHIYSSSDEDAASMQKEFCDTYRLVQEEELAGLTKQELTQRVLDLEEKIQMLESKKYRKNIMMYLNGTSKDDEESIDPDEYRLMQMQIRELTSQNKVLQTEIETLKQVQSRTNDSDSSVDSESSSDSSDSSSSSSDGQEIEMSFLVRSSGRDHDDQRQKNE
ncbi:protein HEXIM1-like [Daktulosphaira vitifoliae]|uniref:protein HEXIM1-like n=1 Tax=Daktulosphaira vitifoliae TaxID=58002 RepID=UPI0021AA3542|nr:protein HEXIM1-like [Daktulosphaira vitifoliae]XP_050523239.1 protein HEXIM1-like [Daktulosphaira vitifoliae]